MKNDNDEIYGNEAEFEGEYIRVDSYSKKTFATIIGFIISSIVCYIFKVPLGISAIIILIVSIVGMIIAPGRVVHHVPKVDLVDLEYRPSTHTVKIQFDRDRTKRKQPVVTKK